MARFHDLEMLLLLWMLPILIGFFVYARYKRRQALYRFAEAHLQPVINISTHSARRRWKAVLLLAAFGFGVVAVARPAWNPTPKTIERKGRDVVFLLDVSKSMLAEDLSPNRLERAKLAINDCVDRL